MSPSATAPATLPGMPPGVVLAPGMSWSTVAHLPAAGGVFLGSPSLVRLPDGAIVAGCDRFGAGSGCDTSWIHRSEDDGATWRRCAELRGQWWSTLFLHRGALWLLGTTREYGDLVIRRSSDGGWTWSEPRDAASGLLRDDGRYHCGPQPVLVHGGRIWRAIEDLHGGWDWGRCFRAGMLSAPLDADLLRADAWTVSRLLPSDPAWLGGRFGGWLEGNAVAAADGRVLDLLRVDVPAGQPEVAAVVAISADGREASFDSATGLVPFPGAAKKFTIRTDPRGGRWWSLVTPADPALPFKAADQRNVLALASSTDLRTWTVQRELIRHPDRERHGFQYVDWQFDGDDIIALCRTAAFDGAAQAANFHDSNLITFHRLRGFRDLR